MIVDALFLCFFGAVVAAAVVAIRTWRVPAWQVGVSALVAAPLVPHSSVGLGVGWDDVLPLVGMVLVLASLHEVRRLPTTALVAGAGLMLFAYAYVLSAAVNAHGLHDGLQLLLRGAGRLSLVAVTGFALLQIRDRPRLRVLVSTGVALVGTAEAVFGLIGFALPLPGHAGIEPTRSNTVLSGAVSGRINGTLALSPDFVGAIFVLTIPITAALALDARRGRDRLLWGGALLAQLLALLLTFVRASLGLVLLALLALLLVRASWRLLAAIGVVLVVVLLTTPMLQRLRSDRQDRYALWWSATRVMRDYPLAGVGPGEMRDVTARDPDRYRRTPYGPAVSNAHNTVLLAGAEAGVGGLVGAAVLNVGLAGGALVGIRKGWRRRGSDALMLAAPLAVLAFLVQGMVNNLLTVTVTGGYLVLIATTLVWRADEPSPYRPRRAAARAPAGARGA